MRRWVLVGMIVGCTGLRSGAQDPVLDLDAIIDLGQKVLEESVDTNILKVLSQTVEVHQESVEPALKALQQVLQGEYILDMAEVGKAAAVLLPALEQNPDTLPYAAWLRTRLDYFDAAGRLTVAVPPPKGVVGQGTADDGKGRDIDLGPAKPPVREVNPSASAQREVWVRSTAQREKPKASDKYVNRLKPIFAAFGVPEELVWVAEVESSFDVQALSPVGAAGLFQLMPMTARSQGLVVGDRDERLHPEKSARGAASYLRRLRDRFGDWRLALAAYNAGEGRVQRLLDQTKGKSFDDIAPKLPAETQMYVPKIEAVLLKREGKRLEDLTG